MQLVGVPAYISPLAAQGQRNYYFCILSPDNCSPRSTLQPLSSGNSSDSGSYKSGLKPTSVPFEDLQLGALIGKGAFGRVYRGLLKDKTVAVKVQSPAWLRRAMAFANVL
jgi:hypothetical protein